jgi:hypothetical protein
VAAALWRRIDTLDWRGIVSTQDPIDPVGANQKPGLSRKHLGFGGAALIALAIASIFALRQGSPEAPSASASAHPAPAAPAMNAPAALASSASAPPPTPAPASSWMRAGALRREAFVACKEQQWEKCGAALDQAATLDPDGERVSVVQHLHDSVDKALHRDALSKAK